MAYISFADTPKLNSLTAIRDLIDAGTHSGIMEVRTGTRPATANDTRTGTLLGYVVFPDPCSAAPGELTASGLTIGTITGEDAALLSGTASWGRVCSRTGADPATATLVTVMDIDITNTGAGGTCQMNTTNIVAGGPINITSFVLTVA